MKKYLVYSLLSLITTASYASHEKYIKTMTTMYPGGVLADYTSNQSALVIEASRFCGQNGELVEKISNITLQVQAEFKLLNKTLKSSATYPKVFTSALVSCDKP